MPASAPRAGRQLGKVSVLALLIAGTGGILATTSSTGNVTAGNFKTALMSRVAERTVPVPVFRFDDADAVASNQIETLSHPATVSTSNLPGKPISQAFTPLAAASLWPMPELLTDNPDPLPPLGGNTAVTTFKESIISESIVPEPDLAEPALPESIASDRLATNTALAKQNIDNDESTLIKPAVEEAGNNSLAVPAASEPAVAKPAMMTESEVLSPLEKKLHLQALAPVESAPVVLQNTKNIVTVKSGDTFSGLLAKTSIKKEHHNSILVNDLVKQHLSNLHIGTELLFEYTPDGSVHSINVKANRDTRIQIKALDSGAVDIAAVHLPIEYERVVTSGTIEQSLYLAAEKANLKQSTIMALSDIFEWELDFARDIRKGDHFSMVYDRLYRDGEYIGDGDILAAEFTRGDRRHTAVRFTDDEGRTDYYSPDGQSKRRAFMRHPVDVVRITSRFDPNRLHPVLHKIRAHKGVDYGAPYGSPIYATADGKIAYAGAKNAYGNTVILKHGDDRSTLYAHMSKIDKNSKAGKRVKRGEVIGYVGKSGRVTGTHLHYEFRIAGKHVDPLKVELPSAAPLDKKYLGRLKSSSQELFAQMRSVLPEKPEQMAAID